MKKQIMNWLYDIFNLGEPELEMDANKALFQLQNHIQKTKIKLIELEIKRLEDKNK